MSTDEALRWRSRPLVAGVMRVVALALPIALSGGTVYCAALVVRPPTGSLSASVAWWIGISGAATVVLLGAGRLSRRLLPLAGLMRLSLVFPDSAPSRFQVAKRKGTLETLEQRLAAARSGWPDVPPAYAARRLLELVALLDTHDRLTRGHSERVRAYAQAIGRELGLEPRELDLLNWAALLHDIGKLEVPGEILTKGEPPDAEEWEILRRHPGLGDALIDAVRSWLGEWSAAVVEHHERWDGSGYPRGLAGTDISLGGRIVAVADAFDVITSARSYKEAFTPSAAREEITRGAGTQFDPDVVRAFLAMSVRGTRSTGALAWLAQAPVLGKVVLVPAATTIAATAVGLGISTSEGHVVPPGAASPPVTARPASKPRVAPKRLVVVARRQRVTAPARPRVERAARARPPHPVTRGARQADTTASRPPPPPPLAPTRPAAAVPLPSGDMRPAPTPVAVEPPVSTPLPVSHEPLAPVPAIPIDPPPVPVLPKVDATIAAPLG